ncbi:MAG TPA: hypothetical protein VH080_03390 [Gemmatimonadaceae bacterium]|nr:hypothetical protein [Gemmatimonadaceae bacterium]
MLVFFAGLATACTASDGLAPGGVSRVLVSYSGERSGTFEASGRPDSASSTGVIARSDYAVAVNYEGTTRPGTFSIIANDDAGAPYGNMLLFGFIPARTGTYQLSSNMNGALLFGVTWEGQLFGEDAFFSIDSGQVTVTSLSSTRAQGTFTARATHYEFNPNPVALGTIHVDGQFNVAFDNVVAIKDRCYLFAC